MTGASCIISQNQVDGTGVGVTTVGDRIGISAGGVGLQVINNSIADTAASAYRRGIYIADNAALVEGNRVINAILNTNSSGLATNSSSHLLTIAS